MSQRLPLLALAAALALAPTGGSALAQDPAAPSASDERAGDEWPGDERQGGDAEFERGEAADRSFADDLEMIPGRVAVLQTLDKISARISTIEVPVGQSVSWEQLDIAVATCARSSPFDRPERAVLMRISERRRGLVPVEVFSGWMFASSPALHAVEHPVYDVVVVNCLADPAATSVPAASEDADSEDTGAAQTD